MGGRRHRELARVIEPVLLGLLLSGSILAGIWGCLTWLF
jgi:hypothetical protein